MHAAGMPKLDVLSAVTSGPAAALGLSDEIGTLAPGSCADVTVLDWREPTSGLTFADNYGNTLVAAGHYEPVLTVRGGQIVFAAASVDHGSKL